MQIIIYWMIKIVLWIGLLFCAYSAVCPNIMIQLLLKAFQLKMKWFGFKGNIEPGDNVKKITRLWSFAMVIIFAGLLYAFSWIFTIAYVME